MKKNIITTIALALTVLAQIQFTDAATLKVTVDGVEQTKGSLQLSLFNTEDGWLKNGVRGETLDAKTPETVWEVPGLEEGEYAIAIIHDIDSNGELNRGAFGMPTEPYGFSNNARGMFGPAKWKEAKFIVKEGENEIRIRIH